MAEEETTKRAIEELAEDDTGRVDARDFQETSGRH
jgi:hypothetical protein